MALETLTVQTANRTGAEMALQSITTAGGFRFLNDGKTMLYVENNAGALNLGFTIQPEMDGEAVTVKTITVTASENWVMGPFPVQFYNDADGYCDVSTDTDIASSTGLVSVVG